MKKYSAFAAPSSVELRTSLERPPLERPSLESTTMGPGKEKPVSPPRDIMCQGSESSEGQYISGVMRGNKSYTKTFGSSTKTVHIRARSCASYFRELFGRAFPHLSSLTKVDMGVCYLFAFLAVACFLTSAISVWTDDPCLGRSLPLMLVSMALVYCMGIYIMLTAPYDIEDCIDNYMEDGEAAMQPALRNWVRCNMLLLCLALFTTIASTVELGQVGNCDKNSTRLAIQVTTLSIAAGVVYICLAMYAIVVVRSHMFAADASSEGPIIITWVRCSCCSRLLKKTLSLLPFIGLAAMGATITAVEWNEQCEQPLHEFLIASSAVFLMYSVIGGLIFWGERHFRSRLVLVLLVTNILLGFGTSVAGIIFVSNSEEACIVAAPKLYSAAVAMKIALLSTTLFVCIFTCCCKVEQCIHFDDESLVHFSQRPQLRNSGVAKKNLSNGFNSVA
jgi:hypothetical protein